MSVNILENYIDGEWVPSESDRTLDVRNPATGETIAQVPLSTAAEVDQAVQAAKDAFQEWRETPPYTRARAMFRLKEAMEENFEDLARQIVEENGKILDEARGEVRRAIENVEGAAAIPYLMMGYNLEDVATGIDEYAIRQPMGVFFAIAPFNFPAMVPFWFMPYAIACGNTYIVKPSEQTPLTQARMFDLIDEADFPPGVVNLVNGDRVAAEALLQHPDTVGVSFVGSTPVARHVYQMATSHGKRAQCQGGAKNFLTIMPDAVMDRTVAAIMTSAFGTAGQRCLAGSVVLAVGDSYEPLREKLVEAARQLKIGNGMDQGTQMGPVISAKSLERVCNYIQQGVDAGAELLLDGRGIKVDGYPNGYFVGPTIFDKTTPEMPIIQDEIFGPVLSIMQVDDFDEAVDVLHTSPYGNAASIFTASGKWAREFQYRVQAGNIGVNIGIAAPIAAFPFAGMKDSFFGDLHGQGLDGINFFTDRKVVITRWF
ncbi:MAG: CoA-acylating methylmalonate-semialdehyde dehydrogenase [Anaerolineae bacterium]|nr:CoA-acylating methylmalonate-semialdehyde dehydrogenase [Anaerolineae bacterium]